MRVSIDRIGLAMRCPTGMSDTDYAFRIFAGTECLQLRYFALCLIDIELALLVDERYARTVVPTVFQTMQTFYQNRIRLTLADISNDTTH